MSIGEITLDNILIIYIFIEDIVIIEEPITDRAIHFLIPALSAGRI